jgi:hypothetical protein
MVDGGFRESFLPLESWRSQRLARDQYEIVWVEYTDRVASPVAAMDDVRSFALGLHDEPQVLARAYNEGIRRARGEVVVLPDADVVCEADLLETVLAEIRGDPEMVLYVLRLDQPRQHARRDGDIEHLRATCSIRHTFNYGGCTAVARKWLVRMNGYEQLPFFAGYPYNGGDNYVRFKNMGLKIRWHPTQRVYHPWHPTPPPDKLATASQMDRFIAHRAATWDWLAYDGLDASRNRPCDPEVCFPSDWPAVMTERGAYRPPDPPGAVSAGTTTGTLRRAARKLRRTLTRRRERRT